MDDQTGSASKHQLKNYSSVESMTKFGDNVSSSIYGASTEDSDDGQNTTDMLKEVRQKNFLHDKHTTNTGLKNNDAQVFTRKSSRPQTMIDQNKDKKDKVDKPIKKHQRIRAALKRKLHISNTETSGDNDNTNTLRLLKVELPKLKDPSEIVDDRELENSQYSDDAPSIMSSYIAMNSVHESFQKRYLAKTEVYRMEHLLDPPKALNHNMKLLSYPYTDLIAPHNIDVLLRIKHIPVENLLIQHKPFRHKKIRYRTQRKVIRIRDEAHELKERINNKHSKKIEHESSSSNIETYQDRLSKNLNEARKKIAEHDPNHSGDSDSEEDIDEINEKLKEIDKHLAQESEEYQNKLIPLDYPSRRRRKELVSAPFIPRQARSLAQMKAKNESIPPIEPRFDPTTFLDLNKEAEEFFGSDVPFWDQPLNSSLLASSMVFNDQLADDNLLRPSKSSKNFITKNATTDNTLQVVDCKKPIPKNELSHELEPKDSEFFDCPSSPIQRRKSKKPSHVHGQKAPIIINESESVEF